jgi:hypothetical protein
MSRKGLGAERKAEEGTKLIDWGRGLIPRTIVTAAMIAVLLFNTMALFMSAPYVIRGLPDEQGSYVSGAVRFPFLPMDDGNMTVTFPQQLQAYRPFPVRIEYARGLIPYGMQVLSFGSVANRYVVSMGRDGDAGNWNGSVLVPGLPGPGVWNMTLIGLDGPDGIEMYRVDMGSIHVSGLGPGELDVIPALTGDRTVDQTIELRVGGSFSGSAGSIEYRIDDGANTTIPYRRGEGIPVGDLDPGWHLLSILTAPGATASHPFRVPPDADAAKEAPDVIIQAAFGGRDGVYSQDTTGPVRIISGDERAISGSFYSVTMGYVSDPRGHISGPAAEFLEFLPAPAQGVNVSGRIYPASPSSDGGSFEAIVLMDPGLADGSRLQVQAGPMGPRTICRMREFALTLVGGRIPSVEMSADPFLPRLSERYDRPFAVRISDEDYDLGRRTFDGPPSVKTDGSAVQGLEGHPLGYWTDWTYDLKPGVATSGVTLEIDARTTFVYRDNLFVLLPIPPFLFGFETPIVGIAAVVWFFILLSCIVASISSLLVHELKMGRSKGSHGPGGFLGEGSPLYLTALVYSGILFFSVAVVITFNLLDQSTPAPSILSEGTPVHFRMLMLAEASVWEEIVARIGYIGIPLVIIGIFRGRNGIAGGLLGGTARIGMVESLLILASASLFGIAHLGWGPWKVLPTFVSGLLLGYLFVKVGVHASIVVHFLIDYSSFLWEISPGAANFEWAYGMVLLVLLAMGVLSMGIILHRTLGRMGGRAGRRRALWATAALHCSGAMIMAFALGHGQAAIPIMMSSVPLAYLGWYVLKRGGLPTVGRALLLAVSAPTLVLAPLGVAFVLGDAERDQRH